MMDELSDIISDNDKDEVFKRMVGNMFAVMWDRSSVNKSFNSQLQSYRESLLGEDSIDLHFLFCNAHFLLGLSNTCESVLKMCEKELVKDMKRAGMLVQSSADLTPQVSRLGLDTSEQVVMY